MGTKRPNISSRPLRRRFPSARRGRSRSTDRSKQQILQIWPYTRPMMSIAGVTTQQHLVTSTLRLTAIEWESDNTKPLSKAFEESLADFMAAAAPTVTVTPYGGSQSPRDRAYRAIQKAALWMAYTQGGNGPTTSSDSRDQDHAVDRFHDALMAYIKAALAE